MRNKIAMLQPKRAQKLPMTTPAIPPLLRLSDAPVLPPVVPADDMAPVADGSLCVKLAELGDAEAVVIPGPWLDCALDRKTEGYGVRIYSDVSALASFGLKIDVYNIQRGPIPLHR